MISFIYLDYCKSLWSISQMPKCIDFICMVKLKKEQTCFHLFLYHDHRVQESSQWEQYWHIFLRCTFGANCEHTIVSWRWFSWSVSHCVYLTLCIFDKTVDEKKCLVQYGTMRERGLTAPNANGGGCRPDSRDIASNPLCGRKVARVMACTLTDRKLEKVATNLAGSLAH